MTDEKTKVSIVSVPVADLLRVTPFKGHDDIRYYLNGVLVTPYQDHALLVATNGHWMAVYESEDARVDKPRILDVPKWFVNQMEKVQRNERLEDDEEDPDWEDEDAPAPSNGPKTLTVASETSHLTICEHGIERLVKPALPFIDDKFPDWQKVIPDTAELERGLFSPFAVNYFGQLHLAVPNDREYPIVCYQKRGDNSSPGVFRFGGLPMVVVLMPRRDEDRTPKDWPAWMKKEAVEKVA